MKNFIILFIFSFSFLSAYTQTNEQKAYEIGKEAVKLMDQGKVDESLTLLREAQQLDPNSFDYPYEMAYAYSLKGNYKESLKILKKIVKYKELSDRLYQMMGNCYDYLGDSKEAIKTYEKGLTKFPYSGCLYLELGNMQMADNNPEKALAYYEKGIEVEPSHSSNYYWASKLYCGSEDEVWGMIYGEIFMNLERNSKRTVEISKLLYDTYMREIKLVNDSSVSVSFSKNNVIDSHDFKLPFGVGVYEPVLLLSIASIRDFNMDSFSKIRSDFIDLYYKKNLEDNYPNVLFSYQKKVKDAGHIDAYNHWILMQGNIDSFADWQQANEDQWNSFVEWFSLNPIKLTSKNKFVRGQY
ncbi:MAG: tetratricopeptide repeat protein [Prevotella sp.]|jgi:tetratricopeptide (TPR) repeat protein|nr:tetratricopeptide repeat protein [Prevotella sp.]